NKTSTIEEQACFYAALVLQDDDFERSFFAHSIQTSAIRQLLVIVKAKFFSHSAEQKIKAAGGTFVLVAKGTITCVDSARKLSFEKCRDQHVYKIISTITGVDAFRIAAFLEVGSP
ncbi:hypothetical protein PRIPAC_90632, partial [Pristionchus pacificus]|uniref:Ribosomal protein n=1 Tax=Pristionchus pacificus TaxID=54126 RepID=A0A2A6CVI0_PRIPA